MPLDFSVDRIRGLVGIVSILGLLYWLSEDRRRISRRAVFWGLALQWGFGILLLKVPAGRTALAHAGEFVEGVLACALEGAKFVFGE